MILAILGALALAAAPLADPPPPGGAPASAAPVIAPVAAPVVPPADADPVTTARDNLERAEALFAQSCAARSYGSYDDICSELSGQVHQYHVTLDRLVRAQSSKKKPSDTTARN